MTVSLLSLIQIQLRFRRLIDLQEVSMMFTLFQKTLMLSGHQSFSLTKLSVQM
nr:MAG TPA: hypothetical protein [Caudoviricetes sp.]